VNDWNINGGRKGWVRKHGGMGEEKTILKRGNSEQEGDRKRIADEGGQGVALALPLSFFFFSRRKRSRANQNRIFRLRVVHFSVDG